MWRLIIKKRKLLLLLLLLGFTGNSSVAQVDLDDYNAGYYIKNNNEKVAGLIYYHMGINAYIKYKSTKEGKAIKIIPDSCLGFVIADSVRFVRTDSSFEVKSKGTVGILQVDSDFIEVVEEGKIGLYIHHSYVVNRTGGFAFSSPGALYVKDLDCLVIKKDHRLIGLFANVKKRKKYLEKLSIEPELMEILCREKDEDVRKGIREYNTR